ncbi:MAG: hypothetical protein N3B17_02555 [Chlorobi bacterium]|nr:hypothetical protein [Chlorobiota bacterium]
MRWLTALLFSIVTASAQFRIQVVSAVDSSQYPLLSVVVRCTQDGSPTQLDSGTALISSSRFSARPQRIETLDSRQGISKITWRADPRLHTEPSVQIIAWSQSSVASDSVRLPRMPVPRIVSQQRAIIEELDGGTIAPGSTKIVPVYLQLQLGRYDSTGGGELPIRVDSIVSSSPIFRIEWVGWLGAPAPLPALVYSPLPYLMRIHCTPPDTGFHSATITVYYDGGSSLSLPVHCNWFPLPAPQHLQFTWPSGGELLTPCTDVTLRWSGMAADAQVTLEYSLDSGATWDTIVTTTDSSAVWTVPNVPTDRLRFRLRQLDARQRTYRLDDGTPTAASRIAFRSDGTRLLVLHANNGEAVEWDVVSRQITWRAMPPDVGQIQPVYVAYLDTERVLAIYNAGGRGYATLLTTSSTQPLWSGEISADAFGAAALDTVSRTLATLGTLARGIRLYRIEQNAIIADRIVAVPTVATALAIGSGEALIALRDSRLQRYRLPEWSLVGEYNWQWLPHVALLSAMPDGQRVAIGCNASRPSVVQGISAPVFVLDRSTSQIVRSDRRAASTPVAVTASSDGRYLVFGFRGQPQAPLWDLAVNQIVGQATTHEGALATVQFSPDQRYVASSSATAPLELLLRTFLFPETVVSPPLRIGTLSIRTDTLRFAALYAYTAADTIFRAKLCNNGSVPITIADRWVEGEPTFQLAAPVTPDTLRPGECTDIALRFSPTRPGNYYGALVIRHCEQVWRMPLEGKALQRNVSTPDTLDVGSACVGSPSRVRAIVLLNRDPAPLPVGGATIYDAFRSAFRLLSPPRDTVIAGDSALALTIEFTPQASDTSYGTLYISYGWRDYTATVILRGVGVGGTLRPHATPLGFLPEQSQRTLRLYNTQSATITIAAAHIEPVGGFRVSGSFPRSIPPGDSLTLTIERTVPDSTNAVLVIRTEPCESDLRIPIAPFSARATLRIPTVEADVHGRATIPLLVHFTSPFDYGDPLLCSVRIAVHRQLFLPDTVWTTGGTARLASSEQVADRRIATIEIERAMKSGEDTLAVIAGIAALGPQDTSHIEFAAAPFWGSAVAVETTGGILQLTGLCGDRRIIESSNVRMEVFPTPSDGGTVTIAIESDERFEGMLAVYTARGDLVLRRPVTVEQGRTQIALTLAETGTYRVVLIGSKGITSRTSFVIVR